MPRVLSAQEERLLMLAQATYSSASTQEVTTATQEIRSFILQNYPKSFTKLQQLISLKEIDTNTRKSLISHIKTVSLQLKQQLQIEAQHNPDVLSNNKKLLHDIEHILANNQVEAELKQPIAEAYVKIFVLFTPETYDKLLSKARYYLNTKQDLVALHIVESYHLSHAPFKYKCEFYAKVLPMLAEYILQKIKVLYNQSAADINKHVSQLNSHLNLFAELWISMNFEKYESIFCAELSKQNLLDIFQMSLGNFLPQHLLSYIYTVASHFISGLRRSGQYRKYQKFCILAQKHLLQVLNRQMQRQFLLNDITQDYEVRYLCANLSFLIAGVDVYNEGLHLICHNFNMYDIYTKLVYPNFRNLQKYLYNNSHEPQQIFSFLEDLSFGMKSQSPEVLIQKFTCSLAKHSKNILSGIRTLIYTFLFDFLPRNSQGQVKQLRVKYDLSQGVPFWSNVSTFISLKEQLLSILCLTALGVTCFLNDMEFLTDINDFMGQNASFFMTSDPQVEFFTLLIYRNYCADIFTDNKASNLRRLVTLKSLQRGNQSFNRKFTIKILQEQFQESPEFDDLAFTIQMIVDSMANHFDQELFYVVFLIFKNYHKNLQKISSINQITTHILRVLGEWAQLDRRRKGIETNFSLISLLISSHNQQNSSKIFAETVQIVQRSQTRAEMKGEIVLDLMVHMLKKIGSLPLNMEVLLINLKWEFQSMQVINSLTELIRYSSNHIFLNWLAQRVSSQEFTIHGALLLQTLTYYKPHFLSFQTIELLFLRIYSYYVLHMNEFNYISGKLNIVCLFLLRQQKKVFYQILLDPKWREVQAELKNRTKFNHLFKNETDNDQIQLSVVDEFFHMLYYHENIYRWRYDIQVFLITQLKFFQTSLDDEFHLAYANVAMVACITNVIRAYSYFDVENNDFIPDTDGEEVNCRELDIEYEKHLQMMESFNKPEEFKEDYFLLFRNLVNKLRRTHESNRWLQTILKRVFSGQNQQIFDCILHMQRCEGQKVRNIVKVQRIKGQDTQ